MEKGDKKENESAQKKLKWMQNGSILKLLKTTEEDFLIKQLWENSEDYLYLKELEKNLPWVTWEKIIKYTKIKEGKIEGIYWEDDLIFTDTNITTLWKFKKIAYLDISYSKIETLGELETVHEFIANGIDLKNIWKINKIGIFYGEWANIDLQVDIINKTNNGEIELWHWRFGWQMEWIKKLTNLKKIPWNLILEWIELEDLGKIEIIEWYLTPPIGFKKIGNLKTIKGNINLLNLWIDLQLKILKRVNAWLLSIWGNLEFGGDIIWIEKFLDVEYIPWCIHIDSMRFEDKLKFLEKVNNEEITIEGVRFYHEQSNLIYILWEPEFILFYDENKFFPRIWIDTDLNDPKISWWVDKFFRLLNHLNSKDPEIKKTRNWMWKLMKNYYLESIENYKITYEELKENLSKKIDSLELLKKEKEKLLSWLFPDLFESNIIRLEEHNIKD